MASGTVRVSGMLMGCLLPAVRQGFLNQFPLGGHVVAIGEASHQGETPFAHDVGVLCGQRQITDDPDCGEASLVVVVSGRQNNWITVQIVEQLLPRQLGVVFVEDQNLMPAVLVEGVLVVGDAIDVLDRISVIHVPGLADARGTVQVVCIDVS